MVVITAIGIFGSVYFVLERPPPSLPTGTTYFYIAHMYTLLSDLWGKRIENVLTTIILRLPVVCWCEPYVYRYTVCIAIWNNSKQSKFLHPFQTVKYNSYIHSHCSEGHTQTFQSTFQFPVSKISNLMLYVSPRWNSFLSTNGYP